MQIHDSFPFVPNGLITAKFGGCSMDLMVAKVLDAESPEDAAGDLCAHAASAFRLELICHLKL